MHWSRRDIVFGVVCFVKVLVCVCTETNAPEERCDSVKNRCMARVGCGMALHNFFLGCNSEIYGETDECTVQCTRALISLLSTEDKVGLAFTNCNCNGDLYCETRKTRVEVCSTSVLEAIKTLDDSSVVGCSLARWLCEADASCQTALTYYVSHCESLLDGIKCTSRCNNSLAILYRQSKAAKLINCSCDGTEEFECATIRTNTETLCFHKNVGYKIDNKKNSSARQSCECRYILLSICILWLIFVF